MITKKTGDLLSVERGIIVHGCNCQGAMGSGVARLVRNKWPAVYDVYNVIYRTYGLKLGDIQLIASSAEGASDASKSPFLYGMSAQLAKDIIVVNAMTQLHFGSDKNVVYVDYDAVFTAFSSIRSVAQGTGLPVHFPLIGCGLANGKWERVSELIEAALGPDIEAILWELPA
jgi:O-acetyl-ADP-ribose deacetylase (regulator of RNase III)